MLGHWLMPVDPELRKLLRYLEQAGLNQLGGPQLDLQATRKGFTELSKLVPHEEVAETQDITVEHSGGVRVPCRLYTPLSEATRGLLVFYHGGGFVLGGVEEYDGLCRALANASHTRVLSVGYRLAPENRFPAAVEDALAVARYCAGHADQLGFSEGRLAVAGDSAGGNLAAVAAALLKAEIGLRRQVLVYPAVSFDVSSYSQAEYSTGLLLTREALTWFGQLYLSSPSDALDPRFSPMLLQDLRGVAPALVVTAEYDPLRDQGEAYAARLAEEGVPVTRVRVGGMIHGFLSFFGVIRAARDTLNMIGSVVASDFTAKQ